MFLSSRKYDLGWSFRIRIPNSDPECLPIPDPGSRGQKGTGSRIRIRHTAGMICFRARKVKVLWQSRVVKLFKRIWTRWNRKFKDLIHIVRLQSNRELYNGLFKAGFRIRIRIHLSLWAQIRILNAKSGSESRRAKIPTKNSCIEVLDVLFLRAEGFPGIFGVLYGGLGISKLQFLIKK